MTLDTQLRTQLRSAVDDTSVPPGLARAALAGGRSRRRRRNLGGAALLTAAVVGGALLVPDAGPMAEDAQVADGTSANAAAYSWARSLPEGDAPALPYFADGTLWSSGTGTTLPAAVNPSVGPWAVSGGWIVMVGDHEKDLAWAVLSPDGTLRGLPAETYENGLGMARFDVSADGRQAVTGQWLVDVTTMRATRLPHAKSSEPSRGYLQEVAPKNFTDQGLVYEAAPYYQGTGTAWLLRPDGSSIRVDLPSGARLPDSSPGDIAVTYDYSADLTDTCVTSYRLIDAGWMEDGSGCLAATVRETHSVSPGGRWLITGSLPQLWDLHAGELVEVDVPPTVTAALADTVLDSAVWESDDSFLIPVADRTMVEGSQAVDYDESVQVVRCDVSVGTCERAGDVVENRVVLESMSSTAFRFATS